MYWLLFSMFWAYNIIIILIKCNIKVVIIWKMIFSEGKNVFQSLKLIIINY